MRILVLNKSYIPVKFTNQYSAIGKFFCGRVEGILVTKDGIESLNWENWLKKSTTDDWPEDQLFVESVTQRVAIPTVIRTIFYNKIPKVKTRISRSSIISRDHNTCYICGKEYGENNLTIDHIIPRSRGGKTEWKNVATCCKKCNENKGNKLLEEAGLKPKYNAEVPVFSNMSRLKSLISNDYKNEWRMFGL